MNPSDLYSNALAALTATRTTMLTPAWQAALDGETADQRLAASGELIKVQQVDTWPFQIRAFPILPTHYRPTMRR